jgi:hypothetical protein
VLPGKEEGREKVDKGSSKHEGVQTAGVREVWRTTCIHQEKNRMKLKLSK